MIVIVEMQPSGFTFAAGKLSQALEWGKEHAKKWGHGPARVYQWYDENPDRFRRDGSPIFATPDTMTVTL
jgi:hypothetical protein